jgi:hypothetical protein
MARRRGLTQAAKLIGVGAAAGGTASFLNSVSGLKKDATKAGVGYGAAMGATIAITPAMVRSKTVREAGKAAGSVIFRRVKGRIIPIRRKK